MISFDPLDPKTAHIIHFVFEWLAVLIGVQVYRWMKKRKLQGTNQTYSMTSGNNFAVVVGCILGAGIGNKLLFLIEVPQVVSEFGWPALMMGQTIVGGLLGGLIGVEVAKKIKRITHSTGDDFVLPLAVGMVVGRIGCFLAGLNDGTYGIASSLPWAVDFGDGVARHPTQVYDMIWVVVTAGLILYAKPTLSRVPGLSFKLYLAGYLLWRLLVDGIKPVPYEYLFGWSGIQWACLIALLVYVPFVVRDLRKLNDEK